MIRKLFISAVLALMSTAAVAAGKVTGSWNVIPMPQQVTLTKDAAFVIDSKVGIKYDENNEKMVRNAQFLVDNIREIAGIRVGSLKKSAKNIVLALEPTIGNPEGYRIRATKRELRITGATEAAVFYGIQTVTKALPVIDKQTQLQPNEATQIALPAANISDAPRYAYRGFLVDVGRHFFSVEYLKEMIDMFALHNINYFHWHLTEDQGWRIEIKKYPRLEEVGQHRKETITAPNSGEFDGKPVSGFYTQEEAREIVRYAAERYITVIPEIDLPGHMLAALASYPHLGCTGGPYEIPCKFGVFDDVLCGGNPAAMQFAKDVLNEIMDIFPSPYIHIGGDECPKKRWKACPTCQQKIAELGLADIPNEAGDKIKHSKEDQLQVWLMAELEKLIASRGRQMMGWDEILNGDPAESAIVMAWTSPDARLRAAREGHKTIVCPITNFYFSNPRWNKLTGRESIGRVYDMEPTSDQLSAEENKNIIGAEGCIWTEWTKDREKMEWQLLPRLAALAEVQWTQPERKNLDDFLMRLPHFVDIYKHFGWNYKKDILEE